MDGNEPIIEFVAPEEYIDELSDPKPAHKVLPDWYKNLGGNRKIEISKEEITIPSVRTCMPFLEAMSIGWVLELSADVEFRYDGDTWQTETGFPKPLITRQATGARDVDSVSKSFPLRDFPQFKFNTYWTPIVDDGYSVLYTSPLNRFDERFEPFSGIVDNDKHPRNVNIPFIWTGGEFEGTISEGTPIAQVIPFKRNAVISEANVREISESEKEQKQGFYEMRKNNRSYYRESIWEPKEYTSCNNTST